MEEPRTRPGLPGDRSQAAAEKLRALRERANQALEGHRSRLGQIESQLGERVRQLAEEYTAALAPPPVDAQREDELERLRRQVEEGHAKHERFVAQLAAAREQLQAIVAKPCANCEDLSRRLAASDEEVGRLHQQLANAAREHDEDRARHEKFVEQLTAARQAITVLQHSAGESTAELRAELDAGRAAQAAAQQQLAALQVEHAAAQRELEALRVECGEARQQSELLAQQIADERAESLALRDLALAGDSERSVAAAEVADLTARLEAASVERDDLRRDRDELKSQCEQLERARAELAASLAAAQEQATAKGSEAASLARQLATAAEEAERAAQSLAASESHRLTASQALAEAESRARQYEAALAQAQQDLAAARQEAAATADAPEVRAQLAEAQAGAAERSQLVGELKRTLEEARSELTILRASMASTSDLEGARRECQEAQAAIVELQAAAAAAQADASAARERTAVADAAALAAQAALAQAEADAALERQSLRPAAEFDQLQHKFDLALADVQVLKRECSSLRQELAERPQASEAESPELISVRQQRDALAARVEELEADAAAGAAGDVDAQQERDDLERRFQMAVDDLRQLKQENAILRERAETAPRGASSSETPAGGDWASQRARLMALLEEEDESGEISAERVAERATVAKTMAATDRVIASKDEEIAELRTALQTRSEGAAMDQQDAAARTALFDADEVIAAERRRIAQMSAEWEEKLRAAELEFSVQRAKLAREQAAVRERMLEIESAAHATASNPGEPGKPRRRWLAALGLNDEDDAKAK